MWGDTCHVESPWMYRPGAHCLRNVRSCWNHMFRLGGPNGGRVQNAPDVLISIGTKQRPFFQCERGVSAMAQYKRRPTFGIALKGCCRAAFIAGRPVVTIAASVDIGGCGNLSPFSPSKGKKLEFLRKGRSILICVGDALYVFICMRC